jgi:hypothetical protein
MQRIRGVLLTLAAAVAVSAALTASAQGATPLTFYAGGSPLAKGAFITLSSSNLTLASPTDTVECVSSELRGELGSNGLTSDLDAVYAFSAYGNIAAPSEGPCGGTKKLGFRLNNNYGITGTFKSSGKATFTPSREEGEYIFEVTDWPPDDKVCVYTAKKLAGTFPAGKGRTATVVTFKKQKLAQHKFVGEAEGCPKKYELGGEYSMTAEKVTVEDEA